MRNEGGEAEFHCIIIVISDGGCYCKIDLGEKKWTGLDM